MLLPSLGGGIGNSYPPRPGDVMDDRIDSVIQSLTSSVEPSLYQMRSVTSSGVKLEDAAAAAVMFNAASRSSASSTSPPSMDSGNGLDQLIDTFTSTGLLQRSLDADELQIVSQQIQLQMQQTQLQMLQLALRQQQLQAAQMQLKLQHQSHMVHRRQHHQHQQHQHQQQCQQQHQPQQHHQNPSAESQHQSSEQHPCHTSASSTASDVMDTSVDSDNVRSSPGVASRWTSLGERSCDLKSPGAASLWTPPVERTCDEQAAVAASLWTPPVERTCDGRTRAETELDAKSLSNKMEPPSINRVPLSTDRRNIVSANQNQGCWQTGQMTMVTSSLTVDVKQQRSDDLMTHLHGEGMIGITSRPLSSRRCPSASLEEIERFAKLFKRRRIALGFTQCDVGMTMGKLYGNDFSQTTISRFEALNLSFKNMCKLKPLLEKWLDDVGRTGSNASGGNVNGVAQPCSHGSSTGAPQQQQQQQQGVIRTAGSVYSAAMSGASICGPGLGDIHGGSMVTLHAAAAAATIADTLQAANRRRKKRTNIDQTVRQALESFFRCVPKPTTDQINDVAERLGMDRDVIQVWFCNRRQKEKRVHPGAAGTPRHIHGVGSVGTSAVTNFVSSNNGGLIVQSQGHVPAQGHG